MEPSLPDLERQRGQLYAELAGTGDFRRGSITATYRRCGKPNCACAHPDHPGHGPRHLWTHSVAGRTEGRQVAAGPELEKVSREVAGYRRFVALSQRIVEVNEAICEARPVTPLADAAPPAEAAAEKKGLFEDLRAEFAAELERLAATAVRSLGAAGGPDGLASVELAIRTAMQRLGGSLLEDLLSLDTGHRGPRIDCGEGHQAEFVAYRPKDLDTVLGPVTLRRAWYHCPDCGGGLAPRDTELGVSRASLSPGLRAMVARVGSSEPFAQARRDLAELAGIELTAKRLERSAEADGDLVRAATEATASALLAGRVVPFPGAAPVETLYVALDGTGVPTVPRDTEGRRGKGPDGRARTREVKLGCLFTGTGEDERGRPVRDPGSSSWVATFETAERFGSLLYAEARRRGVARARRVIVLGDGAPWIWNLAGEHFPGAIEIVDLYHAREHLHGLGALVMPALGADGPCWLADRLAELDGGDIEALLAAARRLTLPDAGTQEVETALGYFATNRARMRYAHFRELGLFVGSGAVEAGCRAVVHQRLKLSGMRWTVRGAAAIISLRCQAASGRWDEVWTRLRNQTVAA